MGFSHCGRGRSSLLDKMGHSHSTGQGTVRTALASSRAAVPAQEEADQHPVRKLADFAPISYLLFPFEPFQISHLFLFCLKNDYYFFLNATGFFTCSGGRAEHASSFGLHAG